MSLGPGTGSSALLCNAPATTGVYTLSLHDALPILSDIVGRVVLQPAPYLDLIYRFRLDKRTLGNRSQEVEIGGGLRSEEHTSELQSLTKLVCRLLLEKQKTNNLDWYDVIAGRRKID